MNSKKNRYKLKDRVIYEKKVMHPLSFLISYVLCPIYLALMMIIIIVIVILMEIDEVKHFTVTIILFAVLGFITIALLTLTYIFRRKIIKDQMDSYNFDISQIEDSDTFDFSNEDISITFDRNGMYVFDELFYYNHLKKNVVTNNECLRINIFIDFFLSEEHFILLPLNPKVLKMIDSLHIKLENHHILDYIIYNKEDAFKQIFRKGYVIVKK